MIFVIVDRCASPRKIVWSFEITIGLRLTNGIGNLCAMSVVLRIFTCLKFRYFTFCGSCKLGRGEWMNMEKHMLDGLHVSMTKHLVTQEKNLWGRNQTLFPSVRTDRLTSVREIEASEFWSKATGRYDFDSYGIWRDGFPSKESISHLSPIVKVPVAPPQLMNSCWGLIKRAQ